MFAVCAFFAVGKANAQQVWGTTDVFVDTTLRRIHGYHATEVDFIAWQYYEPLVDGFIYDEFGNELDFNTDVDHTGFTAECTTESSYQPGRTYFVISDHYVGLLVFVEQPGGGGPAYWNPFGFGFSDLGGFIPFFGFGPGTGGYVVVQYIYLGSTGWQLDFFGEPHIDQIAPTSAPLDSNIELHFEGTNLGGNPSVNISGSGITKGQIIFSTETRLSLNISIAANAPPGDRSVSISTRGYTSNAKTFTVGDRTPHIDSINPSRGDAGSVVDVTISGTNFGINPAVFVTGGITAQVLSGSTTTQINSRFTIPSGTLAGDKQVTVFSNGLSGTGFQNPGGGSSTSNSVTFTVNATAAPRITDYSPKGAPLGTSIEINVAGENFGTSRTLVIGGQGVTVVSYTAVSDPDHQIVATLNIAENAETGDHSLRVSAGGQLSNSVNFRVGSASPVITSIVPPVGTAGTTVDVVISGRGFGTDPTVGVSGTGVNVTINQKNDTRIEATFQISSLAEAVLRLVTVTSQGINGSGFIASPGGNQSTSVPFDIKKAEVKITAMDKQFAPSVERLNITYQITPVGTIAPFARLEIFKKGDDKNPIFVDNNIPKTGTVQYSQNGTDPGWDGRDSNGNFIGAKGSPYTVKISIDDNANFTNNKKATKEFKVEMIVEASMPPAPPEPGRTPEPGTHKKKYNVIKAWNPNQAVTELDTPITLKISYKNKSGTPVAILAPYKVDWSYIDPDDTSSDRDVDDTPNGDDGNDNAPIANGGKSPRNGGTSIMWKAVTGFGFLINSQGQTATSDLSIVPGSNQGSTQIKFSSSAIGGDNYKLIATVKDGAGQAVGDPIEFEKWSVRKSLDFSAAFKMAGGADPEDYVTRDKVKGAFEGDGYTDYKLLNAVQPFPSPSPAPSPSNWFVPLLVPNQQETPTAQELADYAGTAEPAKTNAKNAITAKAQAWLSRNVLQITQTEDATVNALSPTGATVIGAKPRHPKYDGVKGDGRPSGSQRFYPTGITIHDADAQGTVIPNSPLIDPNLDWNQAPGDDDKTPPLTAGLEYDHVLANGTVIKIAFLFKLPPAPNPETQAFLEQAKIITGRHELGHASDHVLFAPTGVTDPKERDHFTAGLMHKFAESSATSPGKDKFHGDSIKRLRGWTR